MEKKRFIPFDAETFLMIEDVTGTEPKVTEKESYFELKMYAPDKEERIIEAAIYAVQGRYGKRIKGVKTIKELNISEQHKMPRKDWRYIEFCNMQTTRWL